MLELKSSQLLVKFDALGARLQSVILDGVDMVVGNKLDFDLATGDQSAGAVCGRIAGRITKARFPLDGKTVELVPNRGDHQLHGGSVNFCNVSWKAKRGKDFIRFTHSVPDGDQGYPGAVDAVATYRLKDNVLSLELEGTTTKPTVMNFTNHAYWNMTGSDSVLNQELQIFASHYLPLSEELLPSGEISKVEGTRWDFRQSRAIAELYDNCFCLDGKRGEMKRGLTLRDPVSGRKLEVWTIEAAIQMYTAIHWDGTVASNHGVMKQGHALAIEPQNYPDAPNHATFPSAVVRPGEVYKNRMEWRFS